MNQWMFRLAGSRQDRSAGFPTELRVLLFGARSTAALTLSSRARPTRRVTRVFGSRCTLEVDLDREASLWIGPGHGPDRSARWSSSGAVSQGAPSHGRSGAARAKRPPLLRRDARAVRAVLPVHRRRREMPVPHADALRTTRVMDAVFESCRQAQAAGDAWRREFGKGARHDDRCDRIDRISRLAGGRGAAGTTPRRALRHSIRAQGSSAG